MLLMNLESRAVVFEDVARQVLATNHRKPPQYFIDAIGREKMYLKFFFNNRVYIYICYKISQRK